jgi:hypothetical protein
VDFNPAIGWMEAYSHTPTTANNICLIISSQRVTAIPEKNPIESGLTRVSKSLPCIEPASKLIEAESGIRLSLKLLQYYISVCNACPLPEVDNASFIKRQWIDFLNLGIPIFQFGHEIAAFLLNHFFITLALETGFL